MTYASSVPFKALFYHIFTSKLLRSDSTSIHHNVVRPHFLILPLVCLQNLIYCPFTNHSYNMSNSYQSRVSGDLNLL